MKRERERERDRERERKKKLNQNSDEKANNTVVQLGQFKITWKGPTLRNYRKNILREIERERERQIDRT